MKAKIKVIDWVNNKVHYDILADDDELLLENAVIPFDADANPPESLLGEAALAYVAGTIQGEIDEQAPRMIQEWTQAVAIVTDRENRGVKLGIVAADNPNLLTQPVTPAEPEA